MREQSNSAAHPFQPFFEMVIDVERYELGSSRMQVYKRLESLEHVSTTTINEYDFQ